MYTLSKLWTTFIICLFFVLPHAEGQISKQKAIVYLHDGSAYVGKVISEDPFEIELQTILQDALLINKSLVRKIHRGDQILIVNKGKFHKTSGNFISAELSLSLNPDTHVAQFHLMYGRRLNSKLNIGLGVGLSNSSASLPDLWLDNTFLQFFGYGKYYINEKKWRLFTDLKAGYGFALQNQWQFNEQTGGLFLSPGVGIEFANKRNGKWSLKLSQYIQNVSGVDGWTDGFNNPINIRYNHWYNRTSLNVGLTF